MAALWRQQIKAWGQESQQDAQKGKNLNVSSVKELQDARGWVQEAKDLEKTRGKQAGVILASRASAALGRYFRTTDSRQWSAEAYYLAGLSALSLEDLNFLNAPADYFEGCIERDPKGPWASRCRLQLGN